MCKVKFCPRDECEQNYNQRRQQRQKLKMVWWYDNAIMWSGDNMIRLWDMIVRYGETVRYGDNMVRLWDKIMIWCCDKIMRYGNIAR